MATKKNRIASPSIEESPTTVPQLTNEFIPASDFKLIYTNFVQAAYTPLDVSLMLGETLGARGDKWLIENKARVTMSPLEFKIVAKIVKKTLEQYEQQFGEIVVPPGVIPPWE